MPPPQQILSVAWPHLRAALTALLGTLAALAAAAPAEPPPRLSLTGLDAKEVIAFTPQYPLWSDGATRRRWIALPRGAAIDARDPDAWQFPRGTKLWKEFAVDGRPVETRFIERRTDGIWAFASYVWNSEGTEALLAPARGRPRSLPRHSALVQRMRSCQGPLQMPPLGTQRPDDEGLALVERWIAQDLTPRKEP